MARILFLLMATFLLGAAMAGCSPPASPPASAQAGLDMLFERLHSTTNAEEARLLESSIRHVWARTERHEASFLLTQAIAAMHRGALDDALDRLDQVVALAPDLVAGWNLRATVHYLRDDYPAALSDIAITLSLEPRHFGAWAGLGLIMLELDRKDAALSAFETALRFNPHLSEVREDVRALREELAGVPL